MNVWFAGGGYACLWSFGFAASLRESGVKIKRTGGASAGGLVALFCISPTVDLEKIVESVKDSPYSPYEGRFRAFGHHERNLAYMTESVLGCPHDFRADVYEGALWIPIRPIGSASGTWRSRWRSYDDMVDTIVSTGCIPGVSGRLAVTYLDDHGDRRGRTIDGGLYTNSPPKFWHPRDTVVVSPWGDGDFNMDPRPSRISIAAPNRRDMDEFFRTGVEAGKAAAATLFRR